ncbi:hypothetical protein SteCoe_7165 [Stentor coeruleus]|uniref:Uncharacterized protein n=1 Tax=Stentor coeruleus TaxID=5963 RepID=A0A1R2CN67_9CILI|nr:hypothetical protein SteCoe_7165 [Stentor coeruleus]
MGQSSCCSKVMNKNKKEFIGKELTHYINLSDTEKFSILLGELTICGLMLDSEIIEFEKNKVNLLTYAFLVGNLKMFVLLKEKGANYDIFNRKIEELKIDQMYYLCDKGYLDLIQYLLPIYIENTHQIDIEISDTLVFETEDKKKTHKKYTAIQRACEKGHLPVVIALYKYFENKNILPSCFDLEKPCEKRGETCAMIACRNGHYTLVKALYKVCHCDFTKVNNFGENALIICASGLKTKKSFSYFDCINFLIETVNIDISYMYEETLLLLEDDNLVRYYENKLNKIGINAKKQDLEKKYRIVLRFEQRARNDSDDMDLEYMLRDIMVESKESMTNFSVISSITELPESFISIAPLEI